MTVKQLIEHLENMYPDKEQTVAYSLWCIDDVERQAKARGCALTKKEMERVLENMTRKHDAEIGLNWTVLDCHIDMIVDEREE